MGAAFDSSASGQLRLQKPIKSRTRGRLVTIILKLLLNRAHPNPTGLPRQSAPASLLPSTQPTRTTFSTMLSAESIATLRRAADVLLPETWEYFEALLDCVQVLCQEVRRASHKRNKELCEILDAFAFRITSEKREGRAAPEAWSLQFRSLFDRIYTHVDRCDRKTRWEVLLSRRHEKKQVTDFCIEITNLERAMKFSARSELLSGRSTSSESFATPRTNQERF